MTDQQKAIAAYRAGILSKPIVIKTDADLTPKGKRRARFYQKRVIRWYVGGRYYGQLPITQENIKMSSEWAAAQ